MATLERLEKEGRKDERDAYREQLKAAGIRDCVVQVAWTGNADVDIEVSEPSGARLLGFRTAFPRRRRELGRFVCLDQA